MNTPDFILPDQNNKPHHLTSYRGQWVLLYFYPKDETAGCTAEACAFRDAYQQFLDQQIVILGVSADDVNSHHKFAANHKLNFPILSDPDAAVIKSYGAWNPLTHGTKRETFLINPDGVIAKHYENVDPNQHAQEILLDFANLTS